ncbi:MAG: molecular chaperone HtpG, partial [Oscillospiraceae bacterium]
LLDLMINSIYTHKEIFLRELISNASDAIDKLYYHALNEGITGLNRDDFAIDIAIDKENKTLTISDNGCGMSKEELENNLGTIAKSGSFAFKNENEKNENIDIIGQFGVGFYSAFMVSDDVTVTTKKYGENQAYCWNSKGADGYTVTECEKDSHGTVVVLKIKPSTEDENYDEYLDSYRISALVRKYSDYICYPIKMDVEHSVPKDDEGKEFETITENETINSMVPLWKKNKNEITTEEYNNFYKEKYFDYQEPLKVIHTQTEGSANYNALMFIPKTAPFNYYSKNYEKGLALYASGVMIMEKCADLLPDYFSFVRGLVDSQDLSLNISRELLQHDRQLKLIATRIEKKIKSELENMLKNERESYEEFFKVFGLQLKFGIYSDYGTHKDMLKDIVIFSNGEKMVTLKEYVDLMKEEQKYIYYACGTSVEQIKLLPQIELLQEKGYEVLYLTDDIDEFVIKTLAEYEGKQFKSIADGD